MAEDMDQIENHAQAQNQTILENPKISIIVPIHNAEKYLQECLNSIVNQTLREIEIICVDDGSSDGSADILREFEKKDDRIQLIRQKNGGAGAARNNGMRSANGKYLLFLDADDIFEANMAEQAYLRAEKTRADICVFKAESLDDVTRKTSIMSRSLDKRYFSQDLFSRKDAPDTILLFTSPAPWNKLFRRDFIVRNELQFQEIPNSNDLAFVLTALAIADRIAVLDSVLLSYRINTEGSIQSNKHHQYEVIYKAMLELKNRLINYGVYQEIKRSLINFAASSLLWNLRTIYKKDSFAPFFQYCKEHIFEDFELDDKSPDYFFEPHVFIQLQSIRNDKVNEFKIKFIYPKIPAREQWPLIESIYREVRSGIESGGERQTDDPELQKMLSNPYHYFRNTCKKFAERPVRFDLVPPVFVKKAVSPAPEISVIIPVFNDQEHIQNAIESIRCQTFSNWEIICVDDGSSDNSLYAAGQLAESDQRITVISEINLGLGSARNKGCKAARGKYILFLDSDDTLTPNALEELFVMSEKNLTDISYYDMTNIYEKPEIGEKYPWFRTYGRIPVEVDSPISGKEWLHRCRPFRESACCALYKKQFLDENNLRFIEGINHEDDIFTFLCMSKAGRVIHTTNTYYQRLVRESSIMTSRPQFTHFYGDLTGLIIFLNAASSYDEDKDYLNDASRLVRSKFGRIYRYYSESDEKESWVEKLTSFEQLVFQSFILGNEKRILEYRADAMDLVYQSKSYKVGNLILHPANAAKTVFRRLKDHGFTDTIRHFRNKKQ